MRKLYRSRTNRQLAGVIGGIADYTGWDTSLLRILFVLGLIFGFGSLGLVYLIWIFVVPNEEVKG
ncbi:PspC domain-containing protein [Metabacillus iocasae]|uniref:Phage shock protein PspC (Stress-responsive transcriptional regulator) n=1 Tax=Priestia iocasae TaxID=2291674 RepID=A0ABS2QYC8_9BACI|nr:PspC domain-containing protein [Metabacillus iocasae]MBM7704499.1 phage shock protein PspC (stress-responsive transcriptional regulator) [Metabacillus iocasae]